jgi:cyclopropane fatty-acyl-phospholipid synthase-like methyltransferase
MSPDDLDRFRHLSYERFRELATDPSLSPHERIGFPDAYRAGKAEAILRDMVAKVPQLDEPGRRVLDIGPGAGELAERLIVHCQTRQHELFVIDSPEMLAHLPHRAWLHKLPGRFPEECGAFIAEASGTLDVVLVYSVFHYIFDEGSCFHFLDQALRLLAPEGAMLIGDIPNQSKRKRFFSTPRGQAFHRRFMGTDDNPQVEFNVLDVGSIDDAVLISIILRARSAGYDAYWLPQADDLPMSNRREDILIVRP